ncbi:hypothetical protein JHK82_039938 [Glycine max]|nr:hypothetical protein JHK86_040132 [Glycine max]KAG4965740.1 hypothetical protein JHK85_040715 [Glycine max]KAG5110715.1 hypothetical protein JHK82_039938 [Glycine max]
MEHDHISFVWILSGAYFWVQASPRYFSFLIGRQAFGNYNNASGIFDVRKFGATGEGEIDYTKSFKMAWDSACQSESAVNVIIVPQDFSFLVQSTIFTGPCQGVLELKVDGTLMPPDGPESWPKNNSRHQWLVFYRINGMSLEGSSLIDGRGEKWWDLPCKPHKDGVAVRISRIGQNYLNFGSCRKA